MPTDRPARVEIRAATHSDVVAVLTLWRESTAHPTVTDDEDGLTQLVADAPGALLVALDGEVLIGTVIAGWNGWRGSIYRIAVTPSHRRAGVARDLLERAVQRLEDLGARRIDALVIQDDDVARSFWDSVGAPWRVDPLDKQRYVRSSESP